MPFPRLTWAGLLVATLGWGFLLSYPLLAPHVGAPGTTDPARFILIFGENAIITGFALAILGGLEKGLILLMRLTGASVPMPKPRNNGMMQQPQQHQQQPMQHHMPQVHLSQMQMPPMSQMQQAAAQHAMGGPQLMSQRSTNEVVTRGALNGRDYVLFRDGSVLVETLLGPRRFSSISEAQEFIGTN